MLIQAMPLMIGGPNCSIQFASAGTLTCTLRGANQVLITSLTFGGGQVISLNPQGPPPYSILIFDPKVGDSVAGAILSANTVVTYINLLNGQKQTMSIRYLPTST